MPTYRVTLKFRVVAGTPKRLAKQLKRIKSVMSDVVAPSAAIAENAALKSAVESLGELAECLEPVSSTVVEIAYD